MLAAPGPSPCGKSSGVKVDQMYCRETNVRLFPTKIHPFLKKVRASVIAKETDLSGSSGNKLQGPSHKVESAWFPLHRYQSD